MAGVPTTAGQAVSVALLGSIALQLQVLYLWSTPNNRDKRVCSQLLSRATSMLCALLAFSSGDAMLKAGVWCHGAMAEVVVDTAQMAAWMTFMHFVLVATRRELNKGAAEPAAAGLAVLASDLAGFACASGWGSWQQSVFHGTPAAALSVVPLALVGLITMRSGFGIGRQAALSQEAEADLSSGNFQEAKKLAEGQAAGLALSFLMSQVACFGLTDRLPAQGSTAASDAVDFGWLEVFFLGTCGVGCVAAVLRMGGQPILGSVVGFSGSWCIFHGLCSAVRALQLSEEEVIVQFLIAILVSVVIFASVPLLGYLDSVSTGLSAHLETRSPLTHVEDGLGLAAAALALPVALTWVRCIELAGDTIFKGSQVVHPPLPPRSLVGLTIATLTGMVWRRQLRTADVKGGDSQSSKAAAIVSTWLTPELTGTTGSIGPMGSGSLTKTSIPAGAVVQRKWPPGLQDAGADLSADLASLQKRMQELLRSQPEGVSRMRVSAQGVEQVPPDEEWAPFTGLGGGNRAGLDLGPGLGVALPKLQ